MTFSLYKSTLALFIPFLLFSHGFGQIQAEICGTDQLFYTMLQEHSTIQEEFENGELIYREYLRNLGTHPGLRSVKRIPVVVHIIEASSQILTTDAEVQSQINVLNEDFRKVVGSNGDGNGVDTEFEFCLATIDPNGCPTTGINRLVDPTQAFSSFLDPLALKSLIQWDPNRYLNIWVPQTIEFFNPAATIAGYATFPWALSAAPNQDGVVVASQFFGRNSDSLFQGRISTHEIGHWLGLYHTFQEGCQGNTSTSCNTNGDRVCDTPQVGASNSGCPGTVNSCIDMPVDLPDLVLNYMDYTLGVCQNMFTQGQKDRMEAQAQTFRSNLWSPANLAATGCDGTISPGCIPTASFVSSLSNACLGQTVNFTDLSSGPATSWNWTFQGGVPATSTLPNPTVTYPNPGVFDVSLTVSNSIGTDSTDETGYMVISLGDPNGTSESFEGDTLFPVGWYSQPTDASRDWELSYGAASDGSQSMVVSNFNYPQLGFTSDLISTVYDFSTWASSNLLFDYAYKRYNAFSIDTFEVRLSTNCGGTWQSIWRMGGLSLPTVGGNAIASPWTPSLATDWKTVSINLDSFVTNQQEVRFQFRSISGNGQNIHLDHVRFSSTATHFDPPIDLSPSLSICPNPFLLNPEISYFLPSSGRTNLLLTDVKGNILFHETTDFVDRGMHRLPSDPVFTNLPSGIYFLRLETEQGTTTRKLVQL